MTDLQNKKNKWAAKQSATLFKTAFTVFFATVFWLLPDTAKAVSSRTFDSMYAAAARGDVPATPASARRSNVRTTGHTTLSCRPAHAPTRPALPASTVPNMKNLSIPTKLSFMPATNIRRRPERRRRAAIIPLPAMFPTGRWASFSGNWTILHKPATRTTCFICRFLFCFPFFLKGKRIKT